MTPEEVCPRCGYRPTGPVDRCPGCDAPLRPQERGRADARRAARIPLSPGVRAEVDGQVAVAVLDLSPLGARLEHVGRLLPAQPCLLTFELSEVSPLRLPATVVWTRAHLREPEPGAPRRLFHSGVEFSDVPPPMARELGACLDRVGGGPGSLPGTPPRAEWLP